MQTKDLNEFKLHYIRKNIQDLNFDTVDGNNYEKYVKRTIFAMFLILKIYDYKFLHPKEVLYQKLMNISKIDKSENLKDDTFGIDMVITGFF